VDEATVVTTILSNNQRTGLCGSANTAQDRTFYLA
jgi:hypothetical protein